MLDLILESVKPFVGHPGRSLMIAVAWTLLAFASRRNRSRYRPLITMAIAWAAFGLYEAEATRTHANIRIELPFTWPALVLITAVSLVRWVHILAVSSKAGVAAGGGRLPIGLVLAVGMVIGGLAIMRYGGG